MLTAFRHEARTYAGPGSLIPACTEVITGSVERGERVLMLAGSDRLDDLRDGLGALSDTVTFVSTDEHGRNPGRIATMLHSFAVRGNGERCLGLHDTTLTGRTPSAVAEAQLAECLLNSSIMQPVDMSVCCLFDSEASDVAALLDMRRAHPVVHGQDTNNDFDEALATALHGGALDPPPDSAVTTSVAPDGLADARAFVRTAIGGHGLAADRADDLVLAANEVVANSLRHGGGRATVAVWFEGDSVVCDVRDHGYLRDPMTGRLAPAAESTSGRGLWLVHHLCDLVQLRSSEKTGTVVRLFVDR